MVVPAISAIESGQLAGIDRIRQRISDIENKFGVGGINGQDFQSILAKEMQKAKTSEKINPVEKSSKSKSTEKLNSVVEEDKTAKTNKVDDDIEVIGKDSQSVKLNEKAKSAQSTTRRLPGEEALPSAMNEAINPFAASAAKPSMQIEPEEVETPTRDTKRETINSTEEMIEAAAEKYNVDSSLVKAIAIAESNMNQNDISEAGAIGVMQLMPETARGLGVDPYDEQQNIEGGTKYLRQMLDTFNGNVRKAVAAYNAGPGAVQKYGGIPPYSETRHYVGRVMDLYR